jgi:hypothetical protein
MNAFSPLDPARGSVRFVADLARNQFSEYHPDFSG